jgi:hypothetical protein
MTRMINRLFPFADRDRHANEASPRELRASADLQAERDLLIGLFVD